MQPNPSIVNNVHMIIIIILGHPQPKVYSNNHPLTILNIDFIDKFVYTFPIGKVILACNNILILKHFYFRMMDWDY